jgi:alcohol dehydrogenase class IV
MPAVTPTISYLTDIYFGAGVVASLPGILDQLGCQRPLVVSDRGLLENGMLDRLDLEQPAIFSDVVSNPSEASALEGLKRFRENECESIIALGGGSPIDCAKAIALLVNHPPPLENYAFANGGLARITADMPPVIAIPTTAGTGSEVGRAALLTMAGGNKVALVSPHLIPAAAVCDPELTLQLPPVLTAATGMDAISHCVETFCSPKFNPVAESIALDGLSRACRHIGAAVFDGSSLELRTEMMMAALQGGLTFQKGLGLVHSLSHPLGALAKSNPHHGTLNAIFLPPILRFNMSACHDKMNRMASAIGIASGEELPGWFENLSAEIGLPTRLRDLGLTREDLEPMAECATLDHCTATNPAPATVEDCRALYNEAY